MKIDSRLELLNQLTIPRELRDRTILRDDDVSLAKWLRSFERAGGKNDENRHRRPHTFESHRISARLLPSVLANADDALAAVLGSRSDFRAERSENQPASPAANRAESQGAVQQKTPPGASSVDLSYIRVDAVTADAVLSGSGQCCAVGDGESDAALPLALIDPAQFPRRVPRVP